MWGAWCWRAGRNREERMTTDPGIRQSELFVARAGGYRAYRIPGLAVTPCGTVLAYAEARVNTGSDWDDIDVVMRRSVDGGESWDEPRVLVRHYDYGPGPMNNPVAIPDRRAGAVHLLFCYNYARAFYMRSDDDGASFGDPVEITAAFEAFRPAYDWGVLAIGPGHGIQLASGRLLAPVWLSTSKTHAHRPNRAAVIYSDDGGDSWHAGDMVPDTIPCCNETEAVELADGAVLLNMRNMGEGRRRAVTVSANGITGWTLPRLDQALLEPRCFGTICRLTYPKGDGRSRILFANPDNLAASNPNHAHGFADRKNLTIKLSYDECGTWPVSRVLEPGPSGYSDLAAAPDGSILCLYERGDWDGRPRSLTLARFDLAWLTYGTDSL